MAYRGDITELLSSIRRGERGAMDRLIPLVYEELRLKAHRQLNRRRPGDTLNTTALVHETYLKLVDQTRANWQDRNHFLSVASVAMRRILIDCARRRMARKRGGEHRHEVLDEEHLGVEIRAAELLVINQALNSLTEHEERLGKVVDLRFFGGLTVHETAEVLGVNEKTVRRDWKKARMFLMRALSKQKQHQSTS